ncbi:phage portal protein [Kitasatospora sp. NPDC088548]|uniref:phage portal protein n=1 Tax=Kitasatospora sp. NPDC088548 TaxID=3364075 RepID=UPI003827E18D
MARRFAPNLRRRPAQATPLPVETKAASAWNGSWSSLPGVTSVYGTEGRADGWDLERVVTEGYEQGIWVFKSVETIANHQARLPFVIGRGEKPGELSETLPDHPLYRLLNGQANPMETGRVLRKRLSAQVLLSKRGAFIEVTRSRLGTPTRLDLLPPDRVRPVPDPDGDYISHFELTTRTGRLRELGPERVWWVRDPHPTDPFSGVTPLEAAGISVDLDHLARLYNVTFLKRDGRPGGIVSVDMKGATERQLDRVEARFAPGVDHAGQIAVIGTGPGGAQFIDTSAKPRDMAYRDLNQTSKEEILAAFGVSEAMFGNSAGRTYANAEQDEYNFWCITEVPHLDLISSGFLPGIDVEEGWKPFIDTSSVEVLELPRRERLRVLREEWSAGLISADEYREAAGRDPIGNAQTRALWFSPQKAPVPARPEDAAVLGLGGGPGEGPPLPGGGQPPGEGQPVGGPAAAAVEAARSTGAPLAGGQAADAVAAARTQEADTGATAAAAVASARAVQQDSAPGPAADAVSSARAAYELPQPGAAAAAVAGARQEVKALPHSAREEGGWQVFEPDAERLEAAVAGAVDLTLARHAEVVAARLRSPKIRKGTRFWQPGDFTSDTRAGGAPIDMHRVVASDRWAQEIVETLTPLVHDAVAEVSSAAVRALAGPAAPAAVRAAAVGRHTVLLDALAIAEVAVRRFLQAFADELDGIQGRAETVDALVAAARELSAARSRRAAAAVAQAVVSTALNGAAEVSAAAAGPGVLRTWVTRRDDKVRPEHQAVDGTVLPVLTAYDVGGFPMRYPGDPIAPPSLTHNCRCRLLYSSASPEGD